MNDVIQFPGEFYSEEDRERDRWATVGFCAAAIAGLRDKKDQLVFLRQLLSTRFANVSDELPPVEDTLAFATYSVKTLLEVLTDESGLMAEAGMKARQALVANIGLFQDE